MAEFKVGDTVELKSGGLVMTISSVGNKEVVCNWFDIKNEPKSRSFPKDTLSPSTAS